MGEHAVPGPQETTMAQPYVSNAEYTQRNGFKRDKPIALPELKFNALSNGSLVQSLSGYDFSRLPALTCPERRFRPLRRTRLTIQRSSKDGTSTTAAWASCPEAASEMQDETVSERDPGAPVAELGPAEVASEHAESETTAEQLPEAGLIVEDAATDLEPGQMRKSDFLSQLRTEVCQTVESAIAQTGQTTDGCPYIGRWFDFYDRQDSAHIERAIGRYTPEVSNATSARQYIAAVVQRARQSAETWARTGEITGMPQGLSSVLPGVGLMKILTSGLSTIFFKARRGGAKSTKSPQAIQSELGTGRPLDSGVRSRMQSAFGIDFSHVRTHKDNKAAELSNRFNARAFTVGKHVAFGANEYKPGTPEGDALIAHELAHVVQQGNTDSAIAPMETGNTASNTLEADADTSAAMAAASLWGKARGVMTVIAGNAMPRLRSGLRLQRCSGGGTQVRQPESQGLGRAAASTCAPTLQNPKWDVSNRPRIGEVSGNACAMEFSGRSPEPGSPFGQNGMEFHGGALVPANCPGRLFFTQYVNQRSIDYVACVEHVVVCQHGEFPWGIDKFRRIPQQHGTNVATLSPRAATIPLRFGDSPGNPDLNDIPTLVRFCMASEFLTYIVYEGQNQAPAPLGWMHWQFHATAWRGDGTCPAPGLATGCRGWQVDGLGEKLGDSFGGGGSPPVPLDLTQPVVTPGNAPMVDCPSTICPVPPAGGSK